MVRSEYIYLEVLLLHTALIDALLSDELHLQSQHKGEMSEPKQEHESRRHTQDRAYT
jgi:hypothetical protein